MLEQVPSSRRRPPAAEAPSPLRWLMVCLIVVVLLYVALPTMMAVNRDATVQSVLADSPGLSAKELDFAVGATLAYAAALHVISIILVTWFAVKALAGRRWARVALTCYFILSTAGSAVSFSKGPQFAWAVLATAVVHVVMLALLWVPGSSRRFFASQSTVHKREGGHATAR